MDCACCQNGKDQLPVQTTSNTLFSDCQISESVFFQVIAGVYLGYPLNTLQCETGESRGAIVSARPPVVKEKFSGIEKFFDRPMTFSRQALAEHPSRIRETVKAGRRTTEVGLT
jgi:hypothetical protein